jgi:hypothetical protein
MAWNDIVLSTTLSIAQHEKEVNRQAGYTSRWCLFCPTGGTLTVATTAPKIKFTYHDYTTATVSASLGTVTFPTNKYIITAQTLDALDAVALTYPLGEGNGITIYDSDGANALTLGGANAVSAWVEKEIDLTWQDKINLAKVILKYDIENKLTENRILVDEGAGQLLIDVLTNPQTFSLASDYLALALIYQDLSNGGFNELFFRKYQSFHQRYLDELAKAFTRMNLDPSLTGSTTDYRVNFTARLSR